MKSKKAIVPAMLVLGGLGVGSMKPAPDPVQLPAPPAERIEIEVPGERVEIRFEKLTDKADKSLRDAFNMSEATNGEIVAMVQSKDEIIDKLRALNKQAAQAITASNAELNQVVADFALFRSKASAAEQYQRSKMEANQ